MPRDFYIPESELCPELRVLIPLEDTIIYTTAVKVKRIVKGERSSIKGGELVITNHGVAFYSEADISAGGILSLRGGSISEYVGYDRVVKIVGKGAKVHLVVDPPRDSGESRREYVITVEQSEPHESRAVFKRRKAGFSAVVEQVLYKYRSGEARPRRTRRVKHPATEVRATPRVKRRRHAYCNECGAYLEDPALFCENCGGRLIEKR
jgi:hypothetical protein